MGKKMSFDEIRKRETLNQVALLQSLSQGDFKGSVRIADLRRMGDTGIGTFDYLDGELIMLEGEVYQARADGLVVVAADDMTVPFADVTFMDTDIMFEMETPRSYAEVCATLTEQVQAYNANMFYMVTIDCELASLSVRSAVPRWSGEGSLAEHMATAQRVFEHGGIAGTIVALYCPPFMGGLNLPGWHLHFLSEDRRVGGHVLDFQLTHGFVTMDQTRCFNMILPDEDMNYALLDLTEDQSADLKKVESK